MSPVETVQDIYAAFGRGDIPRVLGHLDPQIRWEDGAPDHGIPWLKPGTGIPTVVQFFQQIGGWTFERLEVLGVGPVGDTVVGLLSVAAHTGHVRIDNLEVHVWRFNAEGKVDRVNHLVDTLQHRQAVAA